MGNSADEHPKNFKISTFSLDTQVDSGNQEEVAGVHLGTLGPRGLDGGPGDHDRATNDRKP